jgi:soluble lytic murein transglycosylase-like protein
MATASRLILVSVLGLTGTGCTTSGVPMSEVLSVAPTQTAPAPIAGPAPTAVERPVQAAAPAPAAPATDSALAADAKPAPAASAFAGVTPSKPVDQVAFAVPQPGATEGRSRLDRLIAHYAAAYGVPETLVHRVVQRESNYRPSAYNAGNWGLMQIRYATARGMGYKGKAEGLLDAETNLRYAVRYLRGAWLVAGGDHDQAVRLYARGYYYDAKRAGLLDETGLGRDRVRNRRPG